jgi:isopenicillin-N epimerase
VDFARPRAALRNCQRQRPPVPRLDLENWLWKTHKIRIRGGDPNKLRLSTPYYLQRKDIDRFLEKFDEYKREKKLG